MDGAGVATTLGGPLSGGGLGTGGGDSPSPHCGSWLTPEDGTGEWPCPGCPGWPG
ncbi:hypothetical protein [Microbispora rosea]